MSYEKINVMLYGGKSIFGGKETPIEADEIFCDRASECTFYKENKCLRCRAMLSPSCQFGSTKYTKGYTSRAKKYYDFKTKYERDEMFGKLKDPSKLIAVMGDTLYMNLKYTLVRKRRDTDEKWRKDVEGYFISEVGFCRGDVFLPLNEVTNTLLYAIFSYEPRAMMGGIIEDYQKKVVPDILQDMRKVAPELYKKFISEYPQYDFTPNYIGKKAYINSLKPNTKFYYRNRTWVYDGEYISTTNFDLGLSSPWWNQTNDGADVRIKVNDKMTFEVKDNSIVDEDTKFE